MTSRQAHDGTRWEVAPIAGPARRPGRTAGHRAADPEPVPEARDLPHKLVCGLRALVDLAAPTVSFTVLPEPESVTAARHFAVSRVHGWGCPALAGDAGLVVSELVTNALRHSAPPAVWSRPPTSGPTGIRLRLLHHAPWLLCGIMDSSPAAPRRREPDYIAETGRGLHLVESFSVRWGW
jgi:hypothetical protein